MKNFCVVCKGKLNIDTKEDIQDAIMKKNIFEYETYEEVENKCETFKDTDIILYIKKSNTYIKAENIKKAITLFNEFNDPVVPITKIEKRNLVLVNCNGLICFDKPYVNFTSIEFREPLSDISYLITEDWIITNKYKLLSKQYMPVRGLCIND